LTGIVPLSSDRPILRLQDIIDNAQAAMRYVSDLDAAALGENRLVYDAVERCLERISEAAAKLGDQAALMMPGVPWRDIRALGNRLRHNYDEIGEDRIWEIVRDDLPPLVAACEAVLKDLNAANSE
jgi:uncharacterized protein with HEPN domain